MLKFFFSFLFAFLSLLTVVRPAAAVTSAELYRTAPLGYGRFEARVLFGAGDGIIGSFFLWKDGSEQSNVYWNELDFEKMGPSCDLQTNNIYGLPQKTSEEKGYALSGLCEGYHTYAYEWTPDYIAWSVDGVEIRRDSGPAASGYADNASEGMQIRFNIWPGNASFGGNFSETSLPAYEYVAWAQFSDYTPGAGDDGSDFTLSFREEFDSSPTGWSKGSWESPLHLSTHSPRNVVVVDGIAVLALTADDATGYTGTPPKDVPGDVPGGTAGTGAGGGSDAAGDSHDAGSGGAGTGGPAPFMGQGSKMGCSFAPQVDRTPLSVGLSMLLGLGLLVRLRRPGCGQAERLVK